MATPVLVVASPAAAHTELVASAPVSGAQVAMTVDRVSLTFSGDLVAGASAVAVTDPSGEDVTTTRSSVDGPVVEVRVALARAGRHVVDYRVVAQDGHVETGSLSFTAIDGGAPADLEQSAEAPGAALTATAPGKTSAGTPVLLWVAGAGGVAVLVLAVWRAAGRRATGKLVVRSHSSTYGGHTQKGGDPENDFFSDE